MACNIHKKSALKKFLDAVENVYIIGILLVNDMLGLVRASSPDGVIVSYTYFQ